jgi:hypothetical protein
MQVFERSVAVMRKSGDNSGTIVTVERPTLNAGFEVVERREQSVRSLGAGKATESSVIQKPDPNGRMTEIVRKQVERTVTPSGIVENVAEFEAVATGQMQLSRQIVSHTTKSADGSTRMQMDVFEPAPPGKAQAPGAPPQIVRRQVVETRETPSGTVQTVSSAFPRASNPESLGPITQVEKSVCSGDCGKKN